ncbi:MAG: MFS transporter [Chloroflexi bacterium]|nr:MAG: MFS transporter [Chloroflexota bacterium]
MSAVLIGLHLERLGLSAGGIGLILTIALLSAAVTGLAAANLSSRIGRRYTLALAGILMAVTGADLAVASSPVLIGIAAITGMLGTASIDLGAYASVEQASLAESAEPRPRNLAFARYSLTGGLATAAGAALAATATDLPRGRLLFGGYALVGAVTATLALLLSARAEGPVSSASLSAAQVRVLAPLSALFAVDAVGGGLVANAVIAYWLHVRFGASAAALGSTFTAIALLQSASYEVSGRLANRIGLIRTMVFTHVPSNVLRLRRPARRTSWSRRLYRAGSRIGAGRRTTDLRRRHPGGRPGSPLLPGGRPETGLRRNAVPRLPQPARRTRNRRVTSRVPSGRRPPSIRS